MKSQIITLANPAKKSQTAPLRPAVHPRSRLRLAPRT